MMRFLPLVLIFLIAAGAWRRDAGASKPESRTRGILRPAAPAIEDCDVAAPEASAPLAAVRPSLQAQTDGKDRERQLVQKVAALEAALHEALQKVDAHRVHLARALNGKNHERLLAEALAGSEARAMTLEAQLSVLEAAYVEHMIQHRRSD